MDTSQGRRAPRVWPSLLALVLVLPAAMVLGGGMLVVLLIADGTLSGDSSNWGPSVERWVEANFATPKGVLTLVVPGQIIFLAFAAVPALLSPTPFRERLRLVRPRIRATTFALALFGTLGIELLVVIAGSHLFPEPSEQVRLLTELIAGTHGAFAVALIFGLSIVPGFVEELFFRGYVQSRLVDRFGPSRGLLPPTIAFALAHLDPQHASLVLPLGAWLGYVAWRADSTWASMACHAWNNFAAILIARWLGLTGDDAAEIPWYLYVACGALLVVAAIAVRAFERDARARAAS